jgi:predicted DNA-binding transcriptional regulator YafY
MALKKYDEETRRVHVNRFHRPKESATLQIVLDGLEYQRALSVQYATPDGPGWFILRNRVWQVVFVWKEQDVVYVRAFDSYRWAMRTFRLDRITLITVSRKITGSAIVWYPACWEHRDEDPIEGMEGEEPPLGWSDHAIARVITERDCLANLQKRT